METQTKTHIAPRVEDTIDLLELVSVLLHRWWIIVLTTVVFGFAALGYCISTYVPVYTATAKMYVNNNSINIGASQVSITTSDISAAQSLVQTYSEILKTYLVLDQVSADLADQGYPGFSYENLIGKISCGALNNTEIFFITVRDTDPQRAIDIANTVVDDLPDQIALVIEGSSARTVDRAKTAKLVNPGFQRKVLTAAIAGFALSCGLILLVDYFLNDTLTNADWLTSSFSEIPVLGQVPNADKSESHGYGKYYYYYSSTERKGRKSKKHMADDSRDEGGADRVS